MASDKLKLSSTELSRKEYVQNTLQGTLLGIPYIGSSLERFIFGPALERRWKRLEQTLTEIAVDLDALNQTRGVETEEFVQLLEDVGPSIGKTTTETKRIWFRNLLLNAALTQAGDLRWEETRLAADLIKAIEVPGLEILGTLHRSGYSEPGAVVIFDEPPVIALWPEGVTEPTSIYPLSFTSAVVEEWMRRLANLRVLHYVQPIHRQTSDGQHQTKRGCSHVSYTDLGQLLVNWSLSQNDS